MSEYRAPVRDMVFVINELAGLAEVNQLSGFEDATPDLVEAVLEEASQLAREVIGPVNAIGDTQGTRVESGEVQVPAEFKAAYQQYVDGGWPGLAMSPEYDGQGLPGLVGLAVEEMWQSASLAWSLCPMLTHGAVHAIEQHGSDALRAAYLPKMVAGEWTGTMNLSEPQAGSDLSAIRSQAVPAGEHYKLSGQKIFITWGDHTMTDNVIHLVLARTPESPPGVKGLTLFLVPKFKLNDDGSSGDRNGVTTVSVEHKLGIHGSPTCVLSFEDSEAYVIGELNNGLACMFTMMNRARLNVGLEGIAVSERSYQLAVAHAIDRVQGRAPGKDGSVAIINHPDVRRMLMTMQAEIEAMRAVAYVTAANLEFAGRADDAAVRAQHQARIELLTPIIKAWCTESSQVLTSLGIQVHGGMGYVEETGAAQYFRDARITTIYEGTTGIQANDLVGRKIIRDQGAALNNLLEEITADANSLDVAQAELKSIQQALLNAVSGVQDSRDYILANYKNDPNLAGAVSYHMLMQLGVVAGAWQAARAAGIAQRHLDSGTAEAEFYEARLVLAQFYVEQILPRAVSHQLAIQSGSGTIMSMSEEQFRAD
ncbi:MAG: acyl-CoA dehydrogenase [Gammaproteobacteria bacterium]